MPSTDPAPTRGDRLRRQAWAWYLVPAFLVVALIAGLPRDGAWVATYQAGHALAIAAVIVALRIHRPASARPWRLLALGLTVYFAANAVWMPAFIGLVPPLTFPSLADLMYIAGYGLIVAAMVIAAVARWALRGRGDLLEAAILTLGLAVLWYALFIGPNLDATTGLDAAGRIVSAVYPLIDLAIASVAVVIIVKGLRPSPAMVLFGLYIAAQLAADTIYGHELLSGTFGPQSVALTLWPISLAALGAAALHPSMTALGAADPGATLSDRWRFPIIGLAAVAAPVGLLIAAATDPSDVVPIAFISAALFIVALVRLRGVAIVYRRLVGELAGAQARYRDLVERVPAIVFTDRIGPDGTSIEGQYMSPQTHEILGFEPDKILAQDHFWDAIVHPEDRQRVTTSYHDWARAISSDPSIANLTRTEEYRVVTGDGRVLWFREVARAIAADDGNSHHVQGVLLDITEQKAIQERIHSVTDIALAALPFDELLPELLTRLRAVVHGDSATILLTSGDSTELVVSASVGVAAELDGQAIRVPMGEGFAGRVAAERRTIVVEDLPSFPVYTTALRAVHSIVGVPLVVGDGVLGVIHVGSIEPRTWRSDEIHLVELTARRIAGVIEAARLRADIVRHAAELESRVTERTLELDAARVEAERANRAKGEFLSSMSHDLRTPLNAILGFGQLLELSTPAGPDRESVEQILRAGRQLLAMIDDVLEFTRVDAGRLTLVIEPIPVRDAIGESLDLIRAQADERKVRLEKPVVAEPGLAVLADARRLRQVFFSVLENAVRYNRRGGSVAVSVAPAGQEWVRISVRDTGIGIAAERLPQIFEPLAADHREQPGSRSAGIRLAIGSRLVRAMGGSIFAESQLGSGSTFSLDLPRADSPITPGPHPGPSETDTGRSVPTILYIEDNLPNITLVERLLGRRGELRMLAAMQGRLGLELAREHRPNLILLDLRLPDVTPEEMLRELKADTRTRDIPVVMLSSEVTPSRMAEMRALGASDYLTKPIDVTAFLAAVDRILGTG